MNQPHKHLYPSIEHQALATDFYQLTMMYAYFTAGMETQATFELFVRRFPRNRRFLVAAGLEQIIAYIRDLRFSGEDIAYLRDTPTFSTVGDPQKREQFFERLRAFKFSGNVRAVPEGTIFFPNEPVLQVTGDLFESQLVETYMLSMFNFQTLVASKAARMRLTAGERSLIDFGFRRAHGPQAAMLASRASFVGGFAGTSNVTIARQIGIPVVGTAAHAYTMAFEREEEAFAHYQETFPGTTVLLVDTYDTLRGVERAIALPEKIQGIRLDSGDLAVLSSKARALLDEAGQTDAKIVVSDGLNEYKIAALLEQGAPIDVFGVGTEMVTSRDDPTLAGVYKLVTKQEGDRWLPTMKFSSSKASYPGAKELYRLYDADGLMAGGAIAQVGETPDTGALRAEALMRDVMVDGQPIEGAPALSAIQARTLAQLRHLPKSMQRIGEREDDEQAPVLLVSAQTQALIDVCEERFRVEANYDYTRSVEAE